MILWYDMIWYDVICRDMIWHDTRWYDRIWYGMIYYDVTWLWYDMVWYGMVTRRKGRWGGMECDVNVQGVQYFKIRNIWNRKKSEDTVCV